jgi:hypothetical protein
MPPMYATPTDIRSSSSMRASVKAVIGPVTAGLSDALRLAGYAPDPAPWCINESFCERNIGL